MTEDQAMRKKAEWLVYCLEIGWDKSNLDELANIWDKHKDEYGNPRPPTPPEEERNEAIEFAEWLDNERNKAINGQPVTIWNSKKMWASSEAFKQLYELFKTRNQ